MPVTNYIWDPVSDTVLAETDETDTTTAVYTNEPDEFGSLSRRVEAASILSHALVEDGVYCVKLFLK